MKRPSRLVTILGTVAVLGAAAAWALSSMPHVRFENGVARVVGCDGDSPAEDCGQLACTAALKNEPRIGIRSRIEYTHYRNEADGSAWQMGLAHHPAAPAPGRSQLAVACRLAGVEVVEKVITDRVADWQR